MIAEPWYSPWRSYACRCWTGHFANSRCDDSIARYVRGAPVRSYYDPEAETLCLQSGECCSGVYRPNEPAPVLSEYVIWVDCCWYPMTMVTLSEAERLQANKHECV